MFGGELRPASLAPRAKIACVTINGPDSVHPEQGTMVGTGFITQSYSAYKGSNPSILFCHKMPRFKDTSSRSPLRQPCSESLPV